MSPSPMLLKPTLTCQLLAICFALLLPVRANAWGDYGHRIIARIAAEYLNDTAKEKVIELLRVDTKISRFYYQEHCPGILALSDKATLSANEKTSFLREGLACIAPWPDPPLKFQR